MKLIHFLPFSLAIASIAHSEHLLGLSELSIPDITEPPAFGLQYEYLVVHQQPQLHVIDQSSLELKIFPSVEMEDENRSIHDSDKRSLRRSIPGGYLLYSDFSPKAESCFIAPSACLGFAPITMNLYARPNHLKAFFSSALSLRLQYRGSSRRLWFFNLESKTFFVKSVSNNAKQETCIATLGLSLL